MNEKNILNRPFVIPALALSIALFLGLWVLGAHVSNRGDSTIAVTGSASQSVKADLATWRIEVRRTAYANGTSAAYSQVAKDGAIVASYFTEKKLASATITESVISTDENYNQDQNAPKTYTVRESVIIQTVDVDAIDKLSRELGTLTSRVSADTFVSPMQPEYRVSSLPDLRVSLVGQAVKDAKARAVEIAKSGDSSVGALKSASSGVVQVLAPNSTNIEDYGSYDTSTIQKQVMVTARAVFYVN
jgi:hypothetical protein